MATPVPVVSMMYFLVVTPPKTLVMVRPAFAAMSVKKAMGFSLLGAAVCDDWRPDGVWKGSEAASSAGSRLDRKAAGRNLAESMTCSDGRSWVSVGSRNGLSIWVSDRRDGWSRSCVGTRMLHGGVRKR